MDFDDLLTDVVLLFRQHPEVLAEYQRRFQHVLVDEYQDTNPAQNELVDAARRGAPQRHAWWATPISRSTGSAAPTLRNILEFENAFPDVTAIVLDQNYRRTQNILDAANAVIANNPTASRRSCGPSSAGRQDRAATTPTTKATRPVGRGRRSQTLHDDGDR